MSWLFPDRTEYYKKAMEAALKFYRMADEYENPDIEVVRKIQKLKRKKKLTKEDKGSLRLYQMLEGGRVVNSTLCRRIAEDFESRIR